jgi:hypothetical protein
MNADRRMDSQYIEANSVIERYLADQLTEDERAEFEERLVWCEETRREVEVAERLAEGLRPHAGSRRRRPVWITPLLSAAASAVLAVGLTLQFTGGPAEEMLGVTAASVVHLDPIRSSQQWPEIAVDYHSPWLTLVLYPEADNFSALHVTLERATGADTSGGPVSHWQEVWSSTTPARSAESVAISVRSGLLTPGHYRVRMDGLEGGVRQAAGESRFSAIPVNPGLFTEH